MLCLVTEMSLINVMNDIQLYIHLRLDSFDMLLLLTCCMLVCVCVCGTLGGSCMWVDCYDTGTE